MKINYMVEVTELDLLTLLDQTPTVLVSSTIVVVRMKTICRVFFVCFHKALVTCLYPLKSLTPHI